VSVDSLPSQASSIPQNC